MAVGFYLAIVHAHDPDHTEGPPPEFTAVEPLEVPDALVATDAEPVELRHRAAAAHDMTLSLRQTSRDKRGDQENVLRTRIELGLTEEAAEAPAGRFDRADALGITRRYSHAKAEVLADDDQRVGPGITDQVEDLVRGSVTRMYVAPNGEPVDFEWREVPNPQARRMLFLVRDAQSFLTPRYMGGAVNPGDTWSYKRPLSVADDDGVSADGEVVVDNRFVGTIQLEERRLAVIHQELSGTIDGKLERDEAGLSFTLSGTGKAIMLVDVADGSVYSADVNFERKLSIDNGGQPAVQTSTIFMGLRPADGLKLPEAPAKPDKDQPDLEASKDQPREQ